MPTARRLVDLSHVISDGLVTYPGLPAPIISDHLSREASRSRYAPGTEFQIGRIDMVANTGTYLDTPAHRFEGGHDLSGVDLARVADLPGLLVLAAGRAARAIDAEFVSTALARHEVKGAAVLVQTGWDRHFGTSAYGTGHPFLGADAAAWLVEAGAALVGIDSLNIDDTADGTRPVHTALLGAGIYVVEHLTGLAALPRTGFRFFAVPPRVAGMGTFPVRAFAVVAS